MDKSFDYLCSTLKNGTYTVSIKRKVEPRTLSQNALMWLWFACIERETGTDKLDVHDYYCRKFLPRQICMNGNIVSVISLVVLLGLTAIFLIIGLLGIRRKDLPP